MTSIYSNYFTVPDSPARLVEHDLFFEEVNIHVEDNDIKYGNARNVTAVALADSVITLLKGNLRDILVKNNVGAAVAHLSIVATIKEG